MAATLIHIKSQMLLPRDPGVPEDQLEDPRSELVYQLLEHQKFKAAANVLHQRGLIESAAFARGALESDSNNPEISATVFQLFEVFRDVLERQKAITEIEIARDEMTMAEKIAEIKVGLSQKHELRARELFERAKSRREMVLIFLAVLELVKELQIRLQQAETFGDIVILKREDVPSASLSRQSQVEASSVDGSSVEAFSIEASSGEAASNQSGGEPGYQSPVESGQTAFEQEQQQETTRNDN